MSTEPDRTDRVGHHEGLTRFLLEVGALTSDWEEAWAAVPRAAFLPDIMWPYDMNTGASRLVDRSADPAGWVREAYANVPITIQWDDGRHSGTAPGLVPTSSASMPSVVARMLADLAPSPDARVLEIGTGTGWNAGLLSARLGGRNVVTIEVDPSVAAGAREALKRVGLFPEVVCGDGLDGWPDGAPYDRVIATAGVREVPSAWREQTCPGGLILAPWGTHYSAEDALVRLTVAEDGSASGPFLRPLEFMKLRAQRLDWKRFSSHVGPYPGDAVKSTTTVSLSDLGRGRRFHGAKFVLGLCVADCAHLLNANGSESTAWFFDMTAGSRSWASVVFRPDETAATVYQSGRRNLWDEVTRALDWWQAQGTPGLESFGLTVTPQGVHRSWLGDPSHLVPSFAA